MRYSPYPASEYALKSEGQCFNPMFPEVNKGAPTDYDEAKWNLYWALIPELDQLLELQHGDFDGYARICKSIKFERKITANGMLAADRHLEAMLLHREPAELYGYLQAHKDTMLKVALSPDDVDGWLEIMRVRLFSAQALIDVRDAAEVCRSVVAVDFRARKRL